MINLNSKLIFLVLFTIYFICLNGCSQPEKVPPLKSSVTWLNRTTDDSISFAKKFTLILFITDECEGCSQFSPIINKVAKKYGSTIQLLGVFTPFRNTSLNKNKATQYIINSLHISYPVIFDKSAELLQDYQINVWPTLVLINKHSEIGARIYGVKSFEYINQLLHDNLEE